MLPSVSLMFMAAPVAAISCSTAVVGGGWAGVYAAWRLVVDEPTVRPADMCLFEARAAVGGRTYTVEIDGLTLDIGAYRFGERMHLPADLINNHFKLPTQCYEPSCGRDAEKNQTLYRIVDQQNNSAGYATPVRRMLSELAARGARVYYNHQLTGLYKVADSAGMAQPPVALHFAGGAVATASAVLLNLPRTSIKRLDPASVIFGSDSMAPPFQILRNCTPCEGLSSFQMKVYALYDEPWWITKLNLLEGTFTSANVSPPLVGRYHDGPYTRDSVGAPKGPAALEAVYTSTLDFPEIAWYLPFAKSPTSEPLTITSDPELLEAVHRRLMDYHKAAFAAKGFNASDVPRMPRVALGVWTTDDFAMLPAPLSANMSSMLHTGTCPAERCLEGFTPAAYNTLVGQPNPQFSVHIANNDYAWTGEDNVQCCWAEQSLRSVERTLHNAWGLAKPLWLDAKYYEGLLKEHAQQELFTV